MIFKLSATSCYLFWVRWFVFSCGYIFWKPVFSMCRRGTRWISTPKHRKMCNTSLTQPCHRSHIFPYFGYQFHPRRAWFFRVRSYKKKTWGNPWPSCVPGWLGVTWDDRMKVKTICDDPTHMISMNAIWAMAPDFGSLSFPKSERSENCSHVLLSHFVPCLIIFVHHISTSNHLPAPGSKGTSSSALALDGAWRSERSAFGAGWPEWTGCRPLVS